MSSNTIVVLLMIVVAVTMTTARNFPVRDNTAEPSLDKPVYVTSDLEPAASGHHGHGRVHIKVYRGPSDGHHASHGFWVKQPADDHRK